MRLILRAYRREAIVMVGMAILVLAGLILSGLWWVPLIVVGIVVILAMVGLCAAMSLVTSAGDTSTFGMRVSQWCDRRPFVRVYMAVHREHSVVMGHEQAFIDALSPKQQQRYKKRDDRLRNAAGLPLRTFNH